jgi:Cu/Ag efflux protein CusF
MIATLHRTFVIPLFGSLLAVLIAACGDEKQKQAPGNAHSADTARTYTFYGIPLEIDSAKQMVNINHEQIADYMEPMTMPFKVADTTLYGRIKMGERQRFTLEVAFNMATITRVE